MNSNIPAGGKTMENNRNYKIDLLRAIGILLVILAHVEPPKLILDIRCFDVVLLVLLSGMSVSFEHYTTYWKYVFKRFKKIILPTYLTITIVFGIDTLAAVVFHTARNYSWLLIVKSYLFLDGYPYIWIARVFLMIALIVPLLVKINTRIKKDSFFFLFLGGVFLFYFMLYLILMGNENPLIHYYLFYALPYSLVALIGIRVMTQKSFLKHALLFSTILFAGVLLFLGCTGQSFDPNIDKYPPLIIYLSYGLFAGLWLYLICPQWNHPAIRWLSQNSFTIYLLHILARLGFNLLIRIPSFQWVNNWYLEYLLLVFASITGTYLLTLLRKSRRPQTKGTLSQI
jgi:fucose 4-O-acetylase-like acetyltransferase